MDTLTYWNGTWHEGNPAILGPRDHAMWLGSIVFDGGRAFEGCGPDLDLHAERAVRSARALGLNPSQTPQEILALVGRRAWREGPAHPAGVRWFLAVGLCNGSATFLLYAALGLGSIALVAPLVALFPLMAVVMSFFFLRGEQLHAVGLLGIVVSVAGVILLLAGS